MRISDWSSDLCSSDLHPASVLDICFRYDAVGHFIRGRKEAEVSGERSVRAAVSTSFSLRRSISKRRAIIFCKQLVDLDDQVVAFEPDMEIAVFESLCAEKLAFSDPRFAFQTSRSEERRAGKECVSTCISRWSPYH